MISAGEIQEILSLYRKHGWRQRRILMTDKLKNHLGSDAAALFGTDEIVSADIDAVWFSRASRGEREAWELRHLSPAPFALLEVFDSEDDEDVREATRHEFEEQLKKRILR